MGAGDWQDLHRPCPVSNIQVLIFLSDVAYKITHEILHDHNDGIEQLLYYPTILPGCILDAEERIILFYFMGYLSAKYIVTVDSPGKKSVLYN